MPPLDPPPAPLAPGGNVSPSAPVAPLAPGQGVTPSVPPAPLAAGQAASPSAPPAPLGKGGSVSGPDRIIVTGTLTDGTNPIATPIILLRAGENNGRPFYSENGETYAEINTGDPQNVYALGNFDFSPIGVFWVFGNVLLDLEWVVESDEQNPQDATGWAATGTATGTPVLTLNRGGPAAPPAPFPAGQSSSPSAPPAPLGPASSVPVAAPVAPLAPGRAVTPSAPPAPLPAGQAETPASPPQPV